MSTGISDGYPAFIRAITTLFPAKTRLAHPFQIEKNKEPDLKDGFGIRDKGTTSREVTNCRFIDTHSYSVVLTRQLIRGDHQMDPFDVAYLKLKEDMVSLRKRLLQPDFLTVPDVLSDVEVGAVGPLNTVQGQKETFLYLDLAVTLTIEEDL